MPRRLALPVLTLLMLLASSLPASAARPVRVYEVNVKTTDAAAALQEGMREALIRATGRRDAGTDPALSALVTNAARYVQSSRAVPGGIQVVFDGAAIEREIAAAGRSVWDRERPFTIVVLSPPLTGSAADDARRTLEEAAESRGLPVSLVPMALTDSGGAELAPDAVLQSAQRLGGDAVLIGRADSGASSGQWQWTLLTGLASESWTGALDAGIHGAADALARVQDAALPLTESDALVQVSGVASLADYATIERLLSELPGVRRAGLAEADGASATFRVLIRGGADAVQRGLAGSTRLTRLGLADSRLLYQLHP